jgi:hypothetical protein
MRSLDFIKVWISQQIPNLGFSEALNGHKSNRQGDAD